MFCYVFVANSAQEENTTFWFLGREKERLVRYLLIEISVMTIV